MTNIFKTEAKKERKKRLVQIGVETLRRQGWTVTKEKGRGKSSVRRIDKNAESKLVSIRTTQNKWIAFPPKPGDAGWETLDDVDVVLAVSVDGNEPPREALVHWLDAKEMRGRFDRALKARRKRNRVQPVGRGVWIPLYRRESDNPKNVSFVGGGAGLDHPAIARVPMVPGGATASLPAPEFAYPEPSNAAREVLTIATAKRGLSLSLGVPESAIKITIEA